MLKPGTVKIAFVALCRAWMRHLLMVAIADVAARSDRDWDLIELNRADFLAGLTALHGAAQSTSFVPTGFAMRNVTRCG